jgi:hypothetical protein
LTAEEASTPAPAEKTRARSELLIVRLGWFVSLWLAGVAALGLVASAIHWALASR